MKITELLVESQQLDEGPFTQAVGKVGGKIAKGVANIGKDLKTGFKAGYSGEKPAADPAAAPTTAPAAKAAAPVKKAGGGFIDQFKKGFAQGRSEPAAEPVATAAPAATTNTTAPAADPAAVKQSKIGVGQINKIIPTLRTRDLMSLQANLEKTIASKKKAAPAAPAADATTPPAVAPTADAKVKKPRAKKAVAPTQAEIDADRERLLPQNSSIIRTGASLSETLARKVQEQKQRIYETALMSGTQSVFKK